MRTVLSILILLPLLVQGQENLVRNGDFEQVLNCPDIGGQWFNTADWTNANGSSPDYFHACGPPLIFPPDTFPNEGTPTNVVGYQIPKSGDAYMGFYGVQLGNQEWREYIQAELTDALLPGIRYKVSFYVCLTENSRYAISTLGAYLSVDAISSNDLLVLDAEPQILNKPLYPLTDTAEWILITDTFISRTGGGEKFITIGNFFSDAESDTVFVNAAPPLGARHAYYYIDDVSVIALDSVPTNVGILEAQQLQFTVWPNPATDVVRIKSSKRLEQIRLMDIRGREILVQSSNALTIPLRGIPPGLYLLEATDKEGRRGVKKILVQ